MALGSTQPLIDFFNYWWGGTKSQSTAVTSGLLIKSTDDRWGWFLEQLVEWRLAGETEVLGENLPHRHFVHHKIPHGLEPRTAVVGSQRLTAWAMARPDSASNRNDFQQSSWGVKGGRHVRLTTLPPSVSRLSSENVGASMSHNPMGLHGLLQG
jgi:hypothetical protein